MCISGCVHVSWNSSAGLECVGRYGGWGQSWGARRPGISAQSEWRFINQSGSFINIHKITVQLTALIYGGVWARCAACLHLVVVLSVTLPRPLRSAETGSLLRNQIYVVHLSAPGTDRTSISKPAYGWPSAFWLLTPPRTTKMGWKDSRAEVCFTGSSAAICCYLCTCFIRGLKVYTKTNRRIWTILEQEYSVKYWTTYRYNCKLHRYDKIENLNIILAEWKTDNFVNA